MQWIKYKIKQCTIGEEDVLVNKKVGYNEANLAIAQAEAYNGEYTIIEDETDYETESLKLASNTIAATVAGNLFGIRNMIFFDNAGTEITDNVSVIKCYDK